MRRAMFFGNMWLLAIAVAGVILALIGFGMRDRNPGMVLIGIGFLAVLFAVIKKAIDLFG